MFQEAMNLQLELKNKLTDCITRLESLEQRSIQNRQKIEALALSMGKMNTQTQIPALFKPKE